MKPHLGFNIGGKNHNSSEQGCEVTQLKFTSTSQFTNHVIFPLFPKWAPQTMTA